MSVTPSAVRRAGTAIGIAVLGLVLSAFSHRWGVAAAIVPIVAAVSVFLALYEVYAAFPPLKYRKVIAALGAGAALVLYLFTVRASAQLTMTVVGVDTDAVVDRTWRSGKAADHNRCTIRRRDGTPIPHTLSGTCEGFKSGEAIQVVVDPKNRYAPHRGPKADLTWSAALHTSMAVLGGIGLLASIIILSMPAPPTASATASTST